MTPRSTCFNPEKHITCTETAALAVCIAVIECAVDDVRRYLAPPSSGPTPARTRKAQGQARAVITCRHLRALQAADFLQSDACRELVAILAACGLQVPMRSLFRELKRLKETSR